MTPKHLALWHMRQQKIQEARATYKESRGEIGDRDLALANADFHAMALEALVPTGTCPDLFAHEEEINALQAEFAQAVWEFPHAKHDGPCVLNGHRYDSVTRMLSYSRSMAVGHPGVETIHVQIGLGFHSLSKDFNERRLKVLRG